MLRGVLRRRPDVRLHRRESDIAAMHAQQRRILSALWPLLAPGGRLIVVDFAPHEMEFLRTEHAHRRLGFTREQIAR